MLITYWHILVLLSAIGIYLSYEYKTNGQEAAIAELRITIYKLMLAAERDYKDRTGEERFYRVIQGLYKRLPDTIELFSSEEVFVEFVQRCYDEAKDYLDDGYINNSID